MKYNDKFYPTPLLKLLSIVLKQIKTDEVFGIRKELFFKPQKKDLFQTEIFEQKLHAPLGVAAGPHTQLAQNIIAAWLTGARFIELKTVQTLDQIEVSKPCIDMQDEGYNCEWSQELKIKQSFNEYLNAWIVIHILSHKFGFSETGTIFNMSIGYDYKGIMNENIQWFLSKMNNCKPELLQKINEIKTLFPEINKINIPQQISNNVTLSTMHGCPPEEIESIGKYLISEKKLNTTIKLNPTLLGKKDLHQILKKSGFKTQVPDIAFEHDLKFNQAIKIIQTLKKLAENNKQSADSSQKSLSSNLKPVFFGIKTTNTLESINNKEIFSADNDMMYMSGRALHTISVNVARKLQNEFKGELNISFSGGVDAFNIKNVMACGIMPVTVCSDLLKPGGYGRLSQYFELLRKNFKEFPQKKQALQNLNEYADLLLQNNYYQKNNYSEPSIKTERKLSYFDCIAAPCIDTCPTHQNIPEYMYLTSQGEYKKAYEIIIQTNSLPTITGIICDHTCQYKCTRINYDNSLLIRDIKRFVAFNQKDADLKSSDPSKRVGTLNCKVAIIGAGPAGLSAAYYLQINGFQVTIYEQKTKSGGMVSSAIPVFRILEKDIRIDIDKIEKLGVKIHFEQKVNIQKFDELRKQNNYIFIATGAQSSLSINIEGIDAKGVIDPLEFFYQTREKTDLNIGKNVAVIGGGNTAMDAARIAKRLVGEKGSVRIIYRRTKEQMPAFYEEIIAAVEEEIEIMELISPEKIITEAGKVKAILCSRMELGKKDNSGRPKPIKITNSEFEMSIDTIIPAIGQKIDIDFIEIEKLQSKEQIYTQIENIFIGGDAAKGAASAIIAIADGRKVAEEIFHRTFPNKNKTPVHLQKKEITKDISLKELKLKRTKQIFAERSNTKLQLGNIANNFELVSETLNEKSAKAEADRCLYCDELCNICVTVCPNLANQQYEIEPISFTLQKIIQKDDKYKIIIDKEFKIEQKYQVYNIADWCNECGNCNTFCPTKDAPYQNKPKVHLTKESFKNSPSGFFIIKKPVNSIIFYKKDKKIHKLVETKNYYLYGVKGINIKIDKKQFYIVDYEITNNAKMVDLQIVAEMSVLKKALE